MSTDRSRWSQRKYLRTKRSEQAPTPMAIPPLEKQQTFKSYDAGSWLRSKVLPLFSTWFEPHRRYNPDESFFPFPKITFLIDRPAELLCQICREAKCEIESERDHLGDSTFSILPCGHAAGSRCLQTWLRTHSTCPFCRFNLRYPGCGHKIPARPLTKESVHILPRTLSDRGNIPHLCARCLKKSLLIQAEARFEVAAHEFQQARRRFHHTGSEREEEIMMARREDFETVMQDEVYIRHLSTWLTSW